MRDLTLVYYTANRIPEAFAEKVREKLLRSSNASPIISVSQKPIEFGQNVCMGELGFSPYYVYKQLLEGAKLAQSRFIACCEDDTLYPSEHWSTLPPSDDAFYYNHQRWWLEDNGKFRLRHNRAGMLACIVNRTLLVDTLEKRFEKYPEPPPGRQAWRTWGEPGRVESYLRLPVVKRQAYKTKHAIVTVNHKGSLGGKRKQYPNDEYTEELPVWGRADRLWSELWRG
jgi:hypothetical protein